MTMPIAGIAAALLLAGAALFYLGRKHQQLLANPLSAKLANLLSGLCLGIALVLLLTVAGKTTAVFAWLTGLMLCWTLFPAMIAWHGRRKI